MSTDSLPTYAFLGPDGTFSDAAARGFMRQRGDGDAIRLTCVSIPDVFEAVDRGRATYGVVPVENALEGGVSATLDALAFTSRAQILAELVVDVHQNLIVAPGVALADVRAVVSHPQATAQCRRYLQQNLPGREIRACNSTSDSARAAVEDSSIAGIGTSLAAELCGAQVIAESIEDNLANQTRFLLVGRGRPTPTGDDKTSLALFMQEDRPGVLNMILFEFAYAGINLTMIQSRPTKEALGMYMFFIDLVGHADDIRVRTALDCLRLKLREVRVLGSYPVAQGVVGA